MPLLGTLSGRFVSPISRRVFCGLIVCFAAACLPLSSCTLLTRFPSLAEQSTIPTLDRNRGFLTSPSGRIPYQRWRVPSWSDDMRYVWVVGNHDFRKFDQVEIILYFHGMQSKDYYGCFERELEELAAKRPIKPFVFVGFVDAPYEVSRNRDENRWRMLAPRSGQRPDRLFEVVNALYGAFRTSFPHVKKNNAKIVLAGFSGGGRVLDAVGSWLVSSPRDDPYARVFLSRLSKMVYFDCWFDSTVVDTVPSLLENSPGMKIVGTVHMKKPKENAARIVGKLKMRPGAKKDVLVGAGGRLVIFGGKSHWDAIISRLGQALDV